MKILTAKEFNAKLGAIKISSNSLKGNIQVLIESGLATVQDSGNTVYLSKVLQVCMATKALPTAALKDYIKEHCTNLKWAKNKDGQMVFSKAIKNEDFEVTAPSMPWYEHASVSKVQATPDVDAIARIKTLNTVLGKALKEKHLKDGQEDYVKAVLAAINSVKVA